MRALVLFIFLIPFASCEKPVDLTNIPKGSVQDRQGNTYTTVQIEDQIWTASNLACELFNDGDSIPQVDSSDHWVSTSDAAQCDYDNAPANAGIWGKLYNFKTVESKKLCPTNYHVPSKEEWQLFIDRLGGKFEAGGKMMLNSQTYWTYPNKNIMTNETEMSVIPAGMRYEDGSFYNQRFFAYFWTSTSTEDGKASIVKLSYGGTGIEFNEASQKTGAAVRCIAD